MRRQAPAARFPLTGQSEQQSAPGPPAMLQVVRASDKPSTGVREPAGARSAVEL